MIETIQRFFDNQGKMVVKIKYLFLSETMPDPVHGVLVRLSRVIFFEL